MRIYKTDGTFVENQKDTEFGWSLNGIVVDENGAADKEVNDKNYSKSRVSQLQKEEAFMESVDIIEPEKPVVVKHVKVNIKTAPIVNIVNCNMDVEGLPVTKNKPVKEWKNVTFNKPSKEELSALINPCNIETKALMSVIYFAKYQSLIKEEISAELFKTVNFKATNLRYLIKDKHDNVNEEILKDVQQCSATNEDNMLSLMMELILADIGCNLEDIVDIDEHIIKYNDSGISGVANRVQTNLFGGELSSFNSNDENRCSILSNIGLDDEEKNMQSICEETLEMRLQAAQIRESFQEEENRVNGLIKMTTALREEMREALYLDDILHLLEGNLEKVKLKKLPFKIFYKEQSGLELNLIV